jgi:hypothetical protein
MIRGERKPVSLQRIHWGWTPIEAGKILFTMHDRITAARRFGVRVSLSSTSDFP